MHGAIQSHVQSVGHVCICHLACHKKAKAMDQLTVTVLLAMLQLSKCAFKLLIVEH